MRKYSNDIPYYVINTSHILSGCWFIYIGYMKLTSKHIEEYQYNMLIITGLILISYFIYLIYKHYSHHYTYSLGVSKNIIYATHILHGILFILIGYKMTRKKIEEYDKYYLLYLYLILIGSASALYHAHLMILINTREKSKCINKCII
jgi:hypothetical membrane protein